MYRLRLVLYFTYKWINLVFFRGPGLKLEVSALHWGKRAWVRPWDERSKITSKFLLKIVFKNFRHFLKFCHHFFDIQRWNLMNSKGWGVKFKIQICEAATRNIRIFKNQNEGLLRVPQINKRTHNFGFIRTTREY